MHFGELEALDLRYTLHNKPLVWTGSEFVESYRVCLSFPVEIDNAILEPYVYTLQDKYKRMKQFFAFLGCKDQLTFKCLIDVQREIHDKYDKDTDPVCVKRDRRIVMNIVQELVFLLKAEDDDICELMLPVITGNDAKLRLSLVTECVYTTDSFFLEDIGDDTDIPVMDRRIGIEIAEKLGVQSLSSRIMIENDAEEMEEWGQSEPLTTRIKGLVEDYDDGFAIPKELVQNADDAGAKTVRFLYDERTNDECKSGLLDNAMAECQGPALWVFNDALFLEEDFKNIIKLAGKNKRG